MKTNLKNSILAGFGFAVLMSIFFGIFYRRIDLLLAAFIVCFLGYAILIFIFIQIMTSRSNKILDQMGLSKEDILYHGGANHWKNGEALGGYFVLTKDSLIFWDHGVNMQKDRTKILLQDIIQANKYNSLGIVPNGLEIVQKEKTDKFVVNNRNQILQILANQNIKCS